ncbi:hypothetical protein D9M68_423480 [compost metagenome]
MVAGGLDEGEERLVLRQLADQAVAFPEQVEVGDAPDVHHRRAPVALVVEADAVDAAPDQRAHVRPAGVAADHVELLVAPQGVDQGVLAGDQRVARGGFVPRYVGYPGNARPDGLRRAGDGHVEVAEEPALRGQPVEVRRRLERVAIGADRAGAEGFEHDEDHIGAPLAGDGVRLCRLAAVEVEGRGVRMVDAEVAGDHRVVRLHLFEIVGFLRHAQGVVEEDHRIQAERRDLVVAGEEGVAPAQRHRVFQVDVVDPAEDAEQHEDDHQRAAPGDGPAADAAFRPVQGDPFQAQQQPPDQRSGGQPAEGYPHDRIGLPEHAGGDLRVLDEAQHGGVDAHAEIGVVTEVDDVDEQHRAEGQRQIEARQPAQRAGMHQVPARHPGQQRHRQHQQDGQAQVEAQADAEGLWHCLDFAQGAAVEAGETEEEHPAQGCQQGEEDRHGAQPVVQSTRSQPAHACLLQTALRQRAQARRAQSLSTASQQYSARSGSSR